LEPEEGNSANKVILPPGQTRVQRERCLDGNNTILAVEAVTQLS
jgi:hypothetical protein